MMSLVSWSLQLIIDTSPEERDGARQSITEVMQRPRSSEGSNPNNEGLEVPTCPDSIVQASG
jgi:hypothetical protein